ncbi:hypothetical protein ASG22_19670 [Chryseobacterium sp. Leaf405]|uniref:HD domain-containing protein n=1 Tax=Chryseobacterium sp. Leaf405 TaxID=1736367 RepID=UPI0006FCF7AA|nr:ATP-binding protein [Chryseobacterium sp. Leaf405]KQT30916.1 hypothetical protein ASG22_19670 [Chryseobacterium sp. Leaf405]
MKLIDELKKRSENIPAEDNIKIDLKLYTLAHDLAEKAKSHLSRIVAVLPEFDIHDQNHSEKVIENMEKLLGDTIQDLSSYELFLLYLSAYLHDSGMAPSDFEINTMKLTEGNEKFFDNDFTIKNDAKSPYKFSDGKALIESKKKSLYNSFNGSEKWIFIHKNEEDFIKYLTELFIEYQEFRNGFKKELGSADTLQKFKDINDYIRVDFIRITHHKRAEQYIKNLEREFSNQIQPSALGKKLSHDLAEVCRAHGENIDYLEKFNKNVKYYGSQSTNLQMVAMMLRLADVIHYSFDRAPISLLSSKIFKSDYSFQEWMVKQSGANYSIDNGVISYSAYCDRPNDYFKLHNYIDWIDVEIQNYFRLQRKWDTVYLNDLGEKVDRDNIVNDESKFLPKRGIGFSLNQKKILELLKGVGLYKDEYACLRELYQNSLDACKCMIAKSNLLESPRIGRIEFGVEENGDGDFIYCLDNGTGMNKGVIEKYLLNVGNSYYNSPDFYKEQAKWKGDFTPTSQFGIGILSCFMIGHTIEIITKTETDGYISCVINGVSGNFYYKEAELIDTEKILHTGTLIKVYLNSEIEKIGNENILKWGIGMLAPPYDEEKKDYEYEISKWRNHLLFYISNFISTIPENLYVSVRLNNGTSVSLTSKPFYVLQHRINLGLDIVEDEKFLNNLISYYPYSIMEKTVKLTT